MSPRLNLDRRALLLLPLAAGCANPGPPRPPSLHLPAVVANLQALRVGDRVELSWTTPDHSTDKLPLPAPITAVLCRESPAQKPVCSRLAVTPGSSAASDPLPADLSTGSPRPLAYRVELLNARGRSAGASGPAFTAAGATPVVPAPLRLTATRSGVQITWPRAAPPEVGAAGGGGGTRVQLTRTLLADPDPAHRVAGAPVLLDAGLAPTAPDPGGFLDPTATPRATYLYTAQRVTSLLLAGHPVQMRSASSPPARLTFNVTQPPAVPTGLATIPATALGQAPAIDLSWEPDIEPDLLGYNVYRGSSAAGPFSRLNAEPLPGPSYRDLNAKPGVSYFYAVTAVDTAGNESARSPAIQAVFLLR